MESGSAATNPAFPATRGQSNWQTFVGAVPECASMAQSTDTFQCLQTAQSSALQKAINSVPSIINDSTPFPPTIDGPGGILPDLPSKIYFTGIFARLPFIAGTNLDEGEENVDFDFFFSLDKFS